MNEGPVWLVCAIPCDHCLAQLLAGADLRGSTGTAVFVTVAHVDVDALQFSHRGRDVPFIDKVLDNLGVGCYIARAFIGRLERA